MAVTTENLPEWLLEQIADDASRADERHTLTCGLVLGTITGNLNDECDCGEPARIKAECDAKRRIINDIAPAVDKMDEAIAVEWGGGEADGTADDLLRLLALPYADRPGYRDEWKPQ